MTSPQARHWLREGDIRPSSMSSTLDGSLMNWKEKALHASDAKASLEREEQRRREETGFAKEVEAFQFALRELLEEDIAVDALQVTVDGITFRWMPNHITSTAWRKSLLGLLSTPQGTMKQPGPSG
jgi:hypothetical protein